MGKHALMIGDELATAKLGDDSESFLAHFRAIWFRADTATALLLAIGILLTVC